MIKIGLVGFGVVNSGVYEILNTKKEYLELLTNKEVLITKVLVNNLSKKRDVDTNMSLFTDNIDDFFSNDFDIVVEAITNTDASYEIITRALKKGINVVTASKAVVSKYYNELFSLAEEYNCGLYIEASVAGGVPIIKPLLNTLKINSITSIKAILNGTTNFILSKMYNDGFEFKEALDLAQKLGFAELDPTDDIKGFDALRKLVILSSLAYQTRIFEEDIPCKGITSISKTDIEYIKELGLIIKLIGSSVFNEQGISASVEPILFDQQSVFNTVQLSNNIVSITGDTVGELQFYGQGAGKLPTANSIVSDIMDIIYKTAPIRIKSFSDVKIKSDELLKGNFYIRYNININSANTILDQLKKFNITYEVIHRTDQLVLLTDVVSASFMRKVLSPFEKSDITFLRINEGSVKLNIKTKQKPLIIQKYGGTSLSTSKKIKKVAKKIIDTKNRGYDVVVIVSAMGKETDNLIGIAKQVSSNPSKREMDLLLATGEQISISLVSMAIQDLSEKSIALTTMQSGIITDDFYTNASIVKVNTKVIRQAIDDYGIVVVPGFQGLTLNNDITTLGRGGSDTTAVALSAVLNAECCEIYTDVKGVFTADPNVVKDARLWNEVSYEEVLELASLGAQIMHPRSIELAKKYKVPLIIKSTFDDGEGTKIQEITMNEKVLVRGVTSDDDIVKVSIMEVPDMPGIAYHLFEKLASNKITVDMIIQAVSRDNINDISFTVHKKDLELTLQACESYVKEMKTGTVIIDESVVKLSIVGIGMAGGYTVASTFFKALYESGINIQMISTSEIKISCIIKNDDVNLAVNKIHEYFQLGQEVNSD